MKHLFLTLALALASTVAFSQVGVNTTTPDAMLEVYSTTKGVLVPRLTTAQRDAMVSPLNPANKVQEGTIIYNLDQHCLQYNVAPTGTTPNWVGYGCNGVVVTPGSITTLNCAGATTTGTLTSGTAASGVSSSVPYTGGNGGSYAAQTVTSTTVTGLTATLAAGNFATGAGGLTYTITGTPASSGTASFALSIGGQSCTLNVTVAAAAGSITTLNCAGATTTGTLTSGTAASGVSSSVPYTGGNGGSYTAQTVTSTGVTGLTANLAAGSFATGAGGLTYTITGTPASSGTASFALSIGGKSCTLNVTVAAAAGSIATLNCVGATTTGTLTSGTAASGVSSSVPYTGGNGGSYAAQTVTSTGVTGLTATLAAGNFATGAGSLTYTITGTPSAGGTASFAINIGGKSCTLTRTVAAAITFKKVNKYNGVSVINNQGIGYNGEAIPASSTIEIEVNVTGATPYSFTATDATTGLTYSASGNFTTSGTKLVTLINNGTSIAWDKYGTINMTLTGANNTLALAPRIDIKSIPTTHTDWTYNDVTYGTQTWMDRNLGARRVATAINDVLSYGNHYQWGRPADGHEISVWNGATPTSGRGFYDATALNALATSDAPGHPNFILTNGGTNDWRSNNNNNRWNTANQGPCPVGYHVPTDAQWTTADSFGAWNNNTDTYNSALKLPSAGFRSRLDGLLYNLGTNGYWSSTVRGTNAGYLYFISIEAYTHDNGRAVGYPVRCLKN